MSYQGIPIALRAIAQRRRGWLFLVALLLLIASGASAAGILRLQKGYFWDPTTREYFVPRGLAYQTWNPPVGAEQTTAQIDYDLLEFKKMYANSVRAEFVWNVVETNQNKFDWSRPDHLVAKAEELDLRLFVLIGFQYAPGWFSDSWKAVNDAGSNSFILAYENPQAQFAYSNYIYHVTSRYKNSPAIGGWILGNEYAYYDLWDESRRFLGFDEYSFASFRAFLSGLYTNNITAANTVWGTAYADFDSVPMPRTFNRDSALYYDLTQWRKRSVGNYVALGARAAKTADPNHLCTYSMVGGLFGEADVFYTCEDARTIVEACRKAGFSLDFWSINNYAIATLASERHSVDYGIAKHKAASGLPVLITETGHTSTENLYTDAAVRQAAALPTSVWESLLSGAIGVHIFTWNDRNFFSGDYFPREQGFGIVAQNRRPKIPVYSNIMETFRRMEEIHLDRLLGASTEPSPDVQFFWPVAGDLGWCRANHENYQLWSTFKRLGYQPRLIFDAEFDRGEWAQAPALMLSRCLWMEPRHLQTIATSVLQAGIHVHASTDLPGRFDPHHRANLDWLPLIGSMFGLDAKNASTPWDAGATSDTDLGNPATLKFRNAELLLPLSKGQTSAIRTWKIWQGLTATSGVTVVTDTGLNGTSPGRPALHLNSKDSAKTAINTFALGDVAEPAGTAPPRSWDFRSDWLRAIYGNYFGLRPRVEITGVGANYIYQSLRTCVNGTLLLGLANGATAKASVTLSAPALFGGKTVENLTLEGVIETNSDGVFTVEIPGDGLVLLYAYNEGPGEGQSLVNANANKIWFESAPLVVWPSATNWDVHVGFDLRDTGCELSGSFERVTPWKSFAQSSSFAVSGKGSSLISFRVPDPDLNDSLYVSTADGAQYRFRAYLHKNGVLLSEVSVPVRLSWAVRPLSLPAEILPGSMHQVTFEWEDLPGWRPGEEGDPMDRIALWEPYLAAQQNYQVGFQLLSGGQPVLVDEILTRTGNGTFTFDFTVPQNARGPFSWEAWVRPAPGASLDVIDGFEDRDKGTNAPNSQPLFAPWWISLYTEIPGATDEMYWNSGVDDDSSEGVRAAFIIVTNPPSVGLFSGAYMILTNVQPWALPNDRLEWTNWTFAADVKVKQAPPCILELQLKDARGGQINFTKPYEPGPDGWDIVQASLDRFVSPPWVGYFDSSQVSELVVNLQLLSNAVYHISYDNIRLQGPDNIAPSIPDHDVWDGFDDRIGGTGAEFLLPWRSYDYSEKNNAETLAVGIGSVAADGGHAAFLIVKNPPNPGSYSGFGLVYDQTNSLSLPVSRDEWENYSFRFDFKELNGLPCRLELKLESGDNNYIHFTHQYAGGEDLWDRVHATLDQFVTPVESGPFDPGRVLRLVANVQMLAKGETYEGYFDNIHFDAPNEPLPQRPVLASYSSANDSILIERIWTEPGGFVAFSWSGVATVQSASDPGGPWNNLRLATNHFRATATGTGTFYRLQR